MSNINPAPNWADVRLLEISEFATGGENGNMNTQAQSLAARTNLLKQYTATPFEVKAGGYALNKRVLLDNGDIVRSTIANNTANPNSDMTGWINVNDASFVVDGTQTQKQINAGYESVADMLAIASPQNGQRVYVKSYYVGLNKGGGFFVYDSTKAAINDGGTIINGWVRVSKAVSLYMFGAKGDMKKAKLSCSLSSNLVTSLTDIFTSNDVGKLLILNDGTKYFKSTISGFTNSKNVTLTNSSLYSFTDSQAYYGTDDANAITNWLAYFQYNGNLGCVPSGDYLHTNNIVTAQGYFNIVGSGSKTTAFWYAGDDLGADNFRLNGNPGGVCRFSGFTIESAVIKTSGAGFHAYKAAQVQCTDFEVGSQYSSQRNLKNAVYLENVDQFHFNNYNFSAKSIGVALAGDSFTSGAYDCWFTHGKISGHDYTGVLIGGGMDNIYFDQSMITDNKTGLIVDNSLYNLANGYIELGSQCPVEWSWGNGVYINDSKAVASKTHITIRGHVVWNRLKGIHVENLTNASLSIFSSAISNNTQDGIGVNDATTIVSISDATQISNNGGYGITSDKSVNIPLPKVLKNNTLGAYGPNVNPSSVIYGVNNKMYSDVDAAGTTQTDASKISTDFTFVHSTVANAGVLLPANRVGSTFLIVNASTVTIKLYPNVGSQIGSNSTNTPINLEAGKTYTINCVSSVGWWVSNIH